MEPNQGEKPQAPCFWLYAIRLDDDILQRRDFRDENPDHLPGKPCFYVGCTAKTPDERYAEHVHGLPRSSRKVREYHLHLARRKCLFLGEVSRAEAEAAEAAYADALRRKGYGVWQR